MHIHILIKSFIRWLPFGLVITALSGLVYLSVQQNYRQNANDPQIQIAEDAAAVLQKENIPAAVVPRGPLIDIKKSLAPWVAVYDAKGKPLESSGVLNDAPPAPPLGLFNENSWIDPKTYYTPAGAETRVTWQPEPDVRQAIVVVHATNGEFVVAGRSLREVENRVGMLSLHAFLAWVVTSVSSFVLIAFLIFFKF